MIKPRTLHVYLRIDNRFQHFIGLLLFLFPLTLSLAQPDPSMGNSFENQQAITNDSGGFSHSIKLVAAGLLASGSSEKWTFRAFEYGLQYRYSSPWSVELNTGFRKWSEQDQLVIPLYLGPGYNIYVSDKSVLSIFAGGGPAAIIGNDYGSIFAILHGGVNVELNAFHTKKIIFGFRLVQAMAFHPDSFEYLDISVGMRF